MDDFSEEDRALLDDTLADMLKELDDEEVDTGPWEIDETGTDPTAIHPRKSE